MGWGMNWQYAAQTPTEEYCGQATLARKLSLTEVDGVLTLAAAPAGLENSATAVTRSRTTQRFAQRPSD